MAGLNTILKLRQRPGVAPQVQLAFRLLQLNHLQLEDHLRQALESNPFLESAGDQGVADGPGHEPDTAGADPVTDGAGSRDSAGTGSDTGEQPDYADPGNASLVEHLLRQLDLVQLTPVDAAIGRAIVFSLDEYGYLRDSLEEIRAALAREHAVTVNRLESVLAIIQGLEPAGVAARSVSECLLLQLEQQSGCPETRHHARVIIEQHLELLGRGDWSRLARLLRCTQQQVQAAAQLIRSLNPRPGAAYTGSATLYIEPDVYVRPFGESWEVQINPAHDPGLRMNRRYLDLLRQAHGDETRQLLTMAWEARQLMHALKLRNRTLRKVVACVIARQSGFLSEGVHSLKPLVLRDVAEQAGIHESTVSRAIAGKYIHTPKGVMPVKYFFSSGLDTVDGGTASARSVQARIRALVADEDPARPLSDAAICHHLREAGLIVARRTVAKYRRQLQIPDSRARRQVGRLSDLTDLGEGKPV